MEIQRVSPTPCSSFTKTEIQGNKILLHFGHEIYEISSKSGSLPEPTLKEINNFFQSKLNDSEFHTEIKTSKSINIYNKKFTFYNKFERTIKEYEWTFTAGKVKTFELNRRQSEAAEKEAQEKLAKRLAETTKGEAASTPRPVPHSPTDSPTNQPLGPSSVLNAHRSEALRTQELNRMNTKILALREEIEILTEKLVNASAADKQAIQQRKQTLVDQHTRLTQEKIAFVKAEFPEDPVYALAIPQTLKRGTILSTSGSSDKINNLKQNGIVFDPTKPATGLAVNAPQTPWGVNEMGDRGIYFCKGEPAYLSDDLPKAMGCQTSRDVHGVSIMPISILERAGFTKEEINKAYDKLQNQYDFIQHDGMYPANTEVVFTRNRHSLKLTTSFELNAIGDVVESPVAGTIHSTWQPVN